MSAPAHAPRPGNGRRAFAVAAALTFAAALPTAAQDLSAFNEDDLFGSDETIVETVDEGTASDAVSSLMVTKSVRIGGSFSGSATSTWKWNNPWSGFDPIDPDSYGLEPTLSGALFFDARPSESARFYGSVKSSWPFETTETFLTSAEWVTGPPDYVSTTSNTITAPNAEVFELFSDFSWNDSLYLRFGKQTINWGVGYFFSPANVMNLQVIDPMDPTAQLEGPVSLRAHYSIPGTQNNLWAYAVFDSATMKPEDTAVAARAEFVLGGWEAGLGTWYKNDSPLRGIMTLSGSVRDVSLFGEAYLARGSDKTWVTTVTDEEATNFIETTTDATSPFFKGTTGFMWTQSDWNLTLAGQYYYDGEGYANDDREARIAEAHTAEPVIISSLGSDAAFSGFLKGLILGSGRHYAAFSLSKSELFVDDLSVSLFVIGNLSDFSGYAKPTVSYTLFDGLSASLSVAFAFGLTDSEYLVLNDGPSMAWSIGLTMGSGSF
ncbi:MAG: hypothetical protein E4H20_02805 [Spirochaetales bacterium]|nr:MAG: hypothetical protein E4H20_02805 [Spirochaetales bacterium]